MARNRYGFGSNNRLMDLTGPDGEDNTILVTGRRPIMQGMTIDRGLMEGPASESGQFREYEAWNPRQVGSMPGGERTAATRFGAYRLMDADQRLMDSGYGGIQINDGELKGTGPSGERSVMTMMPEGFAPVMSRDGRLALSPQAVQMLGAQQLMEGGQRDPLMGPAIGARELGNRLSVRKQLQAQADQGFVKPGTDARNLEAMDATLARGDEVWLRRNKPRLMMERGNTASQIMTQAEASQMTPQIMTQDGVMVGYDPIKKQIVSDASGAEAIAQGRIQEAKIQAAGRAKDVSLQGEDDKTILDTISKMQQRKSGKLGAEESRWYGLLMKSDKQAAEEYKRSIIGEWSPEDEEAFGKYREQAVKRGLLSNAPAKKDGKGGQWAR